MVRELDEGAAAGGYRLAMRRVADLMAARAQATGVGFNRASGFCLRAGDTIRAMDALERAYQAHDPQVPYIAVIPLNDALRTNPRFQELLRQLKLPS